MTNDNPMLRRSPEEFYAGPALEAAQAVRDRAHDRLRTVLQRSPDVASARGFQDLPLLVWAMSHRDVAAFEILLDAGASADDWFLVQGAKMSVIALATGSEQPDYLRLLLAHDANPDGVRDTVPPLFTALRQQRMDRFESLRRAGADINRPDGAGKTLIVVAALAKDYVTALRLHAMGADLDVRVDNGISVRDVIEQFPLPADTEQGLAQRELAALLR